jgi:hypothetical protein
MLAAFVAGCPRVVLKLRSPLLSCAAALRMTIGNVVLVKDDRELLQEQPRRCRGARRAEPKVWRHAPPQLSSTSTAMEGEDAIHDVFSSAGLWKESTLFADSDPYESTLFAPLQLDSKTTCIERVYQN